MGIRLKVPFMTTVKGGGVLTFIGTAAKQAVYWFLEALDPRPGMGPWPAVGRLQRPRFRISRIRYGIRFRYRTGIPYGAAVRWKSNDVDDHITMTDKSTRATNAYFAPERPPRIRFGMHYKFGEAVYGQESGLYDRLTVKAVV